MAAVNRYDLQNSYEAVKRHWNLENVCGDDLGCCLGIIKSQLGKKDTQSVAPATAVGLTAKWKRREGHELWVAGQGWKGGGGGVVKEAKIRPTDSFNETNCVVG